MPNNSQEVSDFNGKALFKNIYIIYFMVGLLSIVFAALIDHIYPSKDYFIAIIVKIFETIGVVTLVASIFEYSVKTSRFIHMIQEFLQDIIISKKFLNFMDIDSKKRVMAALIKPTDIEGPTYASLDEYYTMCIDRAFEIRKKCVRSDYVAHIRVFYDSAKNKIAAQEEISYRIHPTKDGYEPFYLGLIESEDACIEFIAINTPDGKREEINNVELTVSPSEPNAGKYITYDLNKVGRNHPHLTIEIRLTEYGFDHWMAIGWHSRIPTDGLHYIIRCEDGITIKSKRQFTFSSKIRIEQSSECDLSFICLQWLNEGTGVLAIVSKNDKSTSIIDRKLVESSAGARTVSI